MQSRVSNRRTHSDRGRSRPKVRCRASAADAQLKSTARKQTQLLDAYWRAKGIFSPEQRARLIEVGVSTSDSEDEGAASTQPQAAPLDKEVQWSGTGLVRAQEVREVSERLWTLYRLLGGGQEDEEGAFGLGTTRESVTVDDFAFMVLRQPALLTTDPNQLVRRLLEMRVATAGAGIDVVSIVVRQPALLTSDSWSLDMKQVASESGQADTGSAQQGIAQLVRAWEHGVAGGDSEEEWQTRLDQLTAYVRQYGDASVGFRDNDARLHEGLDRWAAKQRADHRAGLLSEDRQKRLESVGFQLKDDEAEWIRWHTELANFRRANGHCSPWALSAGVDLRLINWASVQRIARRSKALSESRIARLDDLDFDWTGADPLS